jgi:hypothetical protein
MLLTSGRLQVVQDTRGTACCTPRAHVQETAAYARHALAGNAAADKCTLHLPCMRSELKQCTNYTRHPARTHPVVANHAQTIPHHPALPPPRATHPPKTRPSARIDGTGHPSRGLSAEAAQPYPNKAASTGTVKREQAAYPDYTGA